MTHDEYLALIEQLTAAAAAYYAGEPPTMTDAEFDAGIDAVAAAEATHPDWKASGGLLTEVAFGAVHGGDVTHPRPMKSLEKVVDDDALTRWLNRADGTAYLITGKFDGAAVRASYRNGRLVAVTTRGDGTTGEDVTINARNVDGLPVRLDTDLTDTADVEVTGEIYLTADDFIAASKARVDAGGDAYANPRNAIGGLLRRDPTEASNRYPAQLSFAAYGGYHFDDDGDTTHLDAFLNKLAAWGIATARNRISDIARRQAISGIGSFAATAEDVRRQIRMIERLRPDLPFDIDGAVIALVDPNDRQRWRDTHGERDRVYPGSVAWKYAAEEQTTRIHAITVQVGRTGVLAPVAELDPVEIAGSTVRRATLHTMAMAADVLDIHLPANPDDPNSLGDLVIAKKAGDVIPRVEGVLIDQRPADAIKWQPPTACPKCSGTEIDKSEERWRCVNPDCSLAASIRYWCERGVADVDGVGTALIDTLVDNGTLNSIADLYRLTTDDIATLDGYGKRSAQLAIDAIDATRSLPLARFITGLGIRKTGRTMGRRIGAWLQTRGADDANGTDLLTDLRAASVTDLCEIEGVAQGRAESIAKGLIARADLIDDLLAVGVTPTVEQAPAGDSPLAGKKVVISGSVPGYSRNELKDKLAAIGAIPGSSVSTQTDIFVAETDATSSKAVKARAIDTIQWLTPDEFAATLNEAT